MKEISPIGDNDITHRALDIARQGINDINQVRSDLTQTTDTGDKFIMAELLTQPAAFTSLMEHVAANTKSPIELLIADYALFQMKNGSSSQVDIEATMNAIMNPASQDLRSLVGQLANIPTIQIAPKLMEISMLQNKIDRGDVISTADIQHTFNFIASNYGNGNIPSLTLSNINIADINMAEPTTLGGTSGQTTYQQIISDLMGTPTTPTTQPTSATGSAAAAMLAQRNSEMQPIYKAVTSDIVELFKVYPKNASPSMPNAAASALLNKLYADADNYLKYCGYTEQQKASIRAAVQAMANATLSFSKIYEIASMIFNSAAAADRLAMQAGAKATEKPAKTLGMPTVTTANPANAGLFSYLGNIFRRR